MTVTKVLDGAWWIYHGGSHAETAEALQDDGITADQVVAATVDSTDKPWVLIKRK